MPAREKPILMSAPMVRAILEGRKTQTRRIAPIERIALRTHDGGGLTWSVYFSKPVRRAISSHSGGRFSELEARQIIASMFCRNGKVGDRLWVRETHAIESSQVCPYDPPHNDGRPLRWVDDDEIGCYWEQPHYRATDPAPQLAYAGEGDPCVKWRPSIHMPRWASRITLEITGVRVERLQDISEADAMAEGAPWAACGAPQQGSHKAGFAQLWESINGPASWAVNPWVWAIEFKRVQT